MGNRGMENLSGNLNAGYPGQTFQVRGKKWTPTILKTTVKVLLYPKQSQYTIRLIESITALRKGQGNPIRVSMICNPQQGLLDCFSPRLLFS